MSTESKDLDFIALYGGSGTGKDEMATAIVTAANKRQPNSATIFSTSKILAELADNDSQYPHVEELRASVGDAIHLVRKGIFLPADKIHPLAEKSILLLAQEGYRTIVSPSYPRDRAQRKGLDLILEQLRQEGYNPQLFQAYLKATSDLMRYRMTVVRPRMLREQGIEPRADDLNPKSVENRIREFETKALPLVNQEHAAGRLVVFDASEPLAVVQARAIEKFIG